MKRWIPLFCLLLAWNPGCKKGPARDRGQGPVDAGPAASSAVPRKLPPLTGHAWMEPVKMPQGRSAVVTVPLGATEPRPIVIGIHGAEDRAEWACGGYRIAAHQYPFVICPQGLPAGNDKFSPGGPVRIGQDIQAAISAVRAEFGPYVAPGPIVYAGFSLGAIQGVPLVAATGTRYPRVLLIEGGHEQWTPALASTFRVTGGEMVMMVCASKDCSGYDGAVDMLKRAGIAAKVVAAGTGRHNLDGEMMSVLADNFSWLVQFDKRWEGLTPDAGK